MTSVSFHEVMRGWIGFGERDFNLGMLDGRRRRDRLECHLDVEVGDIEAFAADPDGGARVRGRVECPPLGGTLAVERGRVMLLAPAPDSRHLEMRYLLELRDGDGRALTLDGFKLVQDDPKHDVWTDTTTLYTTVLAGDGSHLASGVLRVKRLDFARQLTTFRARGGGPLDRARALWTFNRRFVGGLARAYVGPPVSISSASFPARYPEDVRWHGQQAGEWEPFEGKERRILGVTAGDGTELTLHHFRVGPGRAGERGPVLLVHGSGVRGDIFFGAPRGHTLVDALLAAGYDPWVANWRGSIDLPQRSWTLDEAAVYDHPALVQRVLAETGRDTVKAIIHCQGSTSFAMAAVAGLLPEVTDIVSNAVSLHPDVTWQSLLRMRTLLPAASLTVDGVDPQWGARPPAAVTASFVGAARLLRRECDDPVCALSNFVYGHGPDVLWRHENLDPDTHRWIGRQFGYVPMSFFRQMAKSVSAGQLVPVSGLYALPDDLLADGPQTGARWTLVAGTKNTCFLPSSQRRTYEWLDGHRPNHHRLRELPGYSHLDVFFGKNAFCDVHPVIVSALDA